ncbi:MAG: hypothetical protein AB1861_22535 [Cyanobacteriota bacterium]
MQKWHFPISAALIFQFQFQSPAQADNSEFQVHLQARGKELSAAIAFSDSSRDNGLLDSAVIVKSAPMPGIEFAPAPTLA